MDWLDTKTLKPGDEVATKGRDYGTPTYRLGKVARITKTGRVTLDDGTQFLASGRMVGAGLGYVPYLVAATDEVREAVKRQRLVTLLRSRLENLKSLPTPILSALAAVFAEPPEPDPTD